MSGITCSNLSREAPWLADPDVTIHLGDVRDVLPTLPAEGVDCVITSPPYWGLRDYGTDGQLGLEPTPDEYVANMVAVFREVRRALAPHGTLWLNLGDSYASDAAKGGSGTPNGRNGRGENYARPGLGGGLKPKDLVGIPWRVAFALNADGWYLRSDIIWSKPNPMPESVTDRPTKSHEYVFLLSKRPSYWFDQEAVREPHQYDGRTKLVHDHAVNGSHDNYANMGTTQERWPNGGRNIRSVWNIATQPFAEAHFATFPEELVRRCLLAGCPARVCRVCGKPSERIVEADSTWQERKSAGAEQGAGWSLGGPRDGRSGTQRTVHGAGMSHDLDPARRETVGWSDCGHDAYRPGVVLDPFLGSGTTALVARNHGRHTVGVELSESYARIAAKRLQQLSLLAEGAV